MAEETALIDEEREPEPGQESKMMALAVTLVPRYCISFALRVWSCRQPPFENACTRIRCLGFSFSRDLSVPF